MIITHDDNMWWWHKLLIYDEDIRSPNMIMHETEEMGYTPESADLTVNYNVKLICCQHRKMIP